MYARVCVVDTGGKLIVKLISLSQDSRELKKYIILVLKINISSYVQPLKETRQRTK